MLHVNSLELIKFKKYIYEIEPGGNQLILYIIILPVSFCSDIWYCNILAYYLGNILAY